MGIRLLNVCFCLGFIFELGESITCSKIKINFKMKVKGIKMSFLLQRNVVG